MYRKKRTAIMIATALLLWALIVLSTLALSGPLPARSVILMIGDGMGPRQVELAHRYQNRPLAMETLPVRATLSTRSADHKVTDSAAAATALATGYKTNNGMIAVTPDGKAQKSVLEAAREAGKATGTITTTHPGHATPASFVAHVSNRSMDEEIVAQAMAAGQHVVMGAGKKLFLPLSQGGTRNDGRNLIEEALKQEYQLVETPRQLMALTQGKVLGLFSSNSTLAYDLDRRSDEEPSLAQMTQKALELLSDTKTGFFLMVEGGRIDTAAHENDPLATIGEVLAFDAAVQVALDYVQQHPDTLLIVTADHETGGLRYAANAPISTLKARKSLGELSNTILANRNAFEQLMADDAGITNLSATDKALFNNTNESKTLHTLLKRIVNTHTGISWSTIGHSDTPVPLYASGARSELFTGTTYPNTEVAWRVAKAMGVQLR